MNWIVKLLGALKRKNWISSDDLERPVQVQLDDPGAFTYDSIGFAIVFGEFNTRVVWNEITQISVYKVDMFTVDRVDMQIVHGEKVLTIHEEVPGWFLFTLKLKEVFPSIPKDWDIVIIQPPFERNFRTIYVKGVPS